MTNENLPTRYGEGGNQMPTWQEPPAMAYGPGDDDADEGGGLDPARLLAAVLRFKWLVVLTTVLGGIAGGLAWNRIALEYVAGASLWIESSDPRGGGFTGGQLLRSSSWVDLLKSNAVTIPVVMDNRLYLNVPDSTATEAFASFSLAESFAPGEYEVLYSQAPQTVTIFRDGVVVENAKEGVAIGASVGFRWVPPTGLLPPDVRVKFSIRVPQSVAASLVRNLGTGIDKNATFIRVTLKGTNPARVATTLNALLDQHVSLAADLKAADLEEKKTVLEAQLATSDNELRTAESELEQFKITTIALPSDAAMPIPGGIQLTQGAAFTTFNNLKIEIEGIRAEIRDMERVLTGVPDSALRVVALEAIAVVRTSSQLMTALNELTTARLQLRLLRQTYTDEHMDVVELGQIVTTLEIQTVPDLMRALIRRLRDREDLLQARIAAATIELGDIPPRTIEESRLEREVALAETLFSQLRARYQEASLASASSLADISVLDRATTPTVPVVDARLRAVALLLMAGLGVGLGLAILIDRLDSRIRYTTDVTDALGLEILGTVPLLGDEGDGSGEGMRHAVEAFRDLRVNLEFAYGAGKPLAITLTSPDQSEGKSTVTSNLAIGFAAAGRRTLVIDGDTRKGDLHRMLDVQRKPGLTDFLRGDTGLQEVVQTTSYSNVDLIASGSRSQSSPELLATGRLGDLLAGLWKHYDVILVDSPPLGAGSDALILATLTGQLGLVLRTGQTNIAYAQAKLAGLERLPVRQLGVILNGFVPGRAQGYYAYSEYIDGYGAIDEPNEPEALLNGTMVADPP